MRISHTQQTADGLTMYHANEITKEKGDSPVHYHCKDQTEPIFKAQSSTIWEKSLEKADNHSAFAPNNSKERNKIARNTSRGRIPTQGNTIISALASLGVRFAEKAVTLSFQEYSLIVNGH